MGAQWCNARRPRRRFGKSVGPGGAQDDQEQTLEGKDAQEQLAEEQRQTTPRRILERSEGFEELSPEVGELDMDAAEAMLTQDLDLALGSLSAMASATDERLRALAQQLASRVIIDLAATAPSHSRGVGRMRSMPLRDAGGDIDIEGSSEALLMARAANHPPHVDDLRMHAWTRPDAALAILVDRSGSMTGERLAIAAVAAAAAAQRTKTDYCVVAFSDKAIVIKGIGEARPIEAVINDVLRLRGFGPTDLSLAFRTAQSQLARSNASRQRTVLLSDCRPTEGGPPERHAAALEQLGVLAPADDCEDAEAFAATVGAKWATLSGPSDVPAAFANIAD